MMSLPLPQSGHVINRAMWLYGIHTVLNNATFLLGFYLLPQGWMRGSPQVAVGGLVAQANSFWSQFGLTLLFNLGLMCGLVVVLNMTRIKQFPTGYLLPIVLGVVGGLISGTNSFAASDLTHYNAWEGTALGLSIGGLEMLAYTLVAAATANLTVEQYRSWWRWSGVWKPVKVQRIRDLRLTRAEAITFAIAVLLLLAAGYRETVFSFSGQEGFKCNARLKTSASSTGTISGNFDFSLTPEPGIRGLLGPNGIVAGEDSWDQARVDGFLKSIR